MKWQRVAAAAALAVLAAVAVVMARRLDVPALRDTVDGAGAWAPLAFVGLQVLLTVPPFPRSLSRWLRACSSARGRAPCWPWWRRRTRPSRRSDWSG